MWKNSLLVLISVFFFACSAANKNSTDPLDLNNKVPSFKKDSDDIDGDDDDDTDSEPTEGLWGFGGMYSLSGYNNPATGSQNCPGDYESVQFLGSPEEDAGLYYCKKNLTDGEKPIYFFGGFYGYHEDGVYENPITGAASCPFGFNSYRVYGYEVPDLNFKDYDLYFCAKQPSSDDEWIYGFGGFYGEGRNQDYKHSQTNSMSCPANHESFPILGSSNADWPAHVCIESLSDEADFLEVDAPPSDIFFYPIFARGLVAFGGMYSLKSDNTPGYPNPAMAGTPNPHSCPSGYRTEKVYGTATGVGGAGWRADWNVFICYKEDQSLFETAVFDFGGIYGFGGGGAVYWNLFTGTPTCPAGFSAAQLTGQTNVDYQSYYCYRPQERDQETPYSFGGLYSDGPGDGYLNPLTQTRGCPVGHDHQNGTGKKILHTNAIDRPLYFCGGEID